MQVDENDRQLLGFTELTGLELSDTLGKQHGT
jgi:hypothetical protein